MQTNQFGDSTALAFCTAKLSNIRNGVRALTLRNERDVKYPLAVLLVDISVQSSEQIMSKENFYNSELKVRGIIISHLIHIIVPAMP